MAICRFVFARNTRSPIPSTHWGCWFYIEVVVVGVEACEVVVVL
jgi:hypothetical protein